MGFNNRANHEQNDNLFREKSSLFLSLLCKKKKKKIFFSNPHIVAHPLRNYYYNIQEI
jgi:hypothetical protein